MGVGATRLSVEERRGKRKEVTIAAIFPDPEMTNTPKLSTGSRKASFSYLPIHIVLFKKLVPKLREFSALSCLAVA